MNKRIFYVDVDDMSPEEADKFIEKVKEKLKNNKLGEVKKAARGAVVFYIDVGQLPPEKASEFIEKVREENKPFLDMLPSDVSVIWLPLRPNSMTKVEYLSLEE
jgi:DNA-directed RNA polymerase subunit F